MFDKVLNKFLGNVVNYCELTLTRQTFINTELIFNHLIGSKVLKLIKFSYNQMSQDFKFFQPCLNMT